MPCPRRNQLGSPLIETTPRVMVHCWLFFVVCFFSRLIAGFDESGRPLEAPRRGRWGLRVMRRGTRDKRCIHRRPGSTLKRRSSIYIYVVIVGALADVTLGAPSRSFVADRCWRALRDRFARRRRESRLRFCLFPAPVGWAPRRSAPHRHSKLGAVVNKN